MDCYLGIKVITITDKTTIEVSSGLLRGGRKVVTGRGHKISEVLGTVNLGWCLDKCVHFVKM